MTKKYIDADRLKAEIKNSIRAYELYGISGPYEGGELDAYHEILSIIDSLQQEQPEVDLEKELRNYNVPFNDCGWERLTHNTLKEIARHFYKLGKNSK